MKVLVVNNMVFGLCGGVEELVDQLVLNLCKVGYQFELLCILFMWYLLECIVGEMLMCCSMCLINVDCVIVMKFLVYLLFFDDKVFWLVYQYCQVYDMWDLGYSNIFNILEGWQICLVIIEVDNDVFFLGCGVYVVGCMVQDCLMYYNGILFELLCVLLNDIELFIGGVYGDYIFVGGCINVGKCQYCLIEVMVLIKVLVKLIVVGLVDMLEDVDCLCVLVEMYGLQGWVKLDIGFYLCQIIVDYVNGVLVCVYLLMVEDFFGYVMMEVCQVCKVVIMVDDLGDLIELIKDGDNGWVCVDDIMQIVVVLMQVFVIWVVMLECGQNVYESWICLDINWVIMVEKLI